MSLIYRQIRTLTIAPGSHPRGLSFLSAASGLVRAGNRLYVVADDENHLGVFDGGGTEPIRLIRLFEGDLPASAKKRKAIKPDLEALLLLPAAEAWPAGALLALGSGSRSNRLVGALLRLDDRGDVDGRARPVDLAPLYGGLNSRCAELNIEGAFVVGTELILLQRGNSRGPNAAIRFPLQHVIAWLSGGSSTSLEPSSIRDYELGIVDGVPLGFTDGTALPDGSWLFSAVAEQTDNSYDDGACLAAMIGIVRTDGTLQSMRRLDPTRKVEGIEAQVAGGEVVVSMVTDADDPSVPAEFGTTTL